MNNKIELAYEYGILINLNSNPWIEGNEIANNNTQATSSKNQISVGLQGNNSPVVKNNVIYGGSSIPTGGISLWVSGASNSSDMIIEGNEIYNNSFGITLLSTSDGVINALIKNNKIYHNRINPNMQVSGSGININGSPFNTPIITGNEIFGNWWGVTIQNGTTVQPGPQPNFGNIENSDPDDDGMNIIHHNAQGWLVFDFYNNCTNDIWAQNNDWRVYDSISIEYNIFHQADDALHGKVIFTPFSSFIPVELISFSGSVSGKTVTLKWETATENNNRGFEVEKLKVITAGGGIPLRGEGQKSKDEWEKIGFVDGYGTTTEKKSYTFIDKNTGAGKYNYRLKQIDYDGSINYSNIIEINIAAPQKFELSQNYPNPFNPTTNIEYHLPADAEVTLKLFNVLGEELRLLLNGRMPAGQHHYQLDASELRSGVYFYRIDAKANDGKIFSETKKLVLVR
jgi:hypothetical protein